MNRTVANNPYCGWTAPFGRVRSLKNICTSTLGGYITGPVLGGVLSLKKNTHTNWVEIWNRLLWMVAKSVRTHFAFLGAAKWISGVWGIGALKVGTLSNVRMVPVFLVARLCLRLGPLFGFDFKENQGNTTHGGGTLFLLFEIHPYDFDPMLINPGVIGGTPLQKWSDSNHMSPK